MSVLVLSRADVYVSAVKDVREEVFRPLGRGRQPFLRQVFVAELPECRDFVGPHHGKLVVLARFDANWVVVAVPHLGRDLTHVPRPTELQRGGRHLHGGTATQTTLEQSRGNNDARTISQEQSRKNNHAGTITREQPLSRRWNTHSRTTTTYRRSAPNHKTVGELVKLS